jgi:hypothetical protein
VSPQRRTRTSFAPKDGANFNRRLNVRLHDDDVAGMESARREEAEHWQQQKVARVP